MSTAQEDKKIAGPSTVIHPGTKQVNRGSLGSTQIGSVEGAFEALGPWVTTIGRIILGLVLAWFGYHELVVPKLWTGYVPFVSSTSQISQVLVLIHGVILSILAVGLIVGVLPRTFAGIAALTMLEIVISLTITAGLSDLVLRDIGVLGLALSVMASRHERLVLQT
ncbi:MAG: hypothetical protein M0Z96_01760 [Actinomycetota bacterium]|nr:hypothetical protein [Actinomycetota bacterium]